MEKLTFYSYIQMRIAGRRTKSIVQDLIDDMKTDKELEGKTGAEIVGHIKPLACFGARDALRRFSSQYKQYCKAHGYESEILTTQ